MKKKMWTDAEREYLREHYANTPTSRIAEHLGRGEGSVYQHAAGMGLKKADEYLQSPESGRLYKGCPCISPGTIFKKGQVPPNKGKAMPEHIREKCLKTAFKKGQAPHNTLHDGYCTKRANGYWYYRISLAKWGLMQRKVWEEANGPVPDGMLVAFKDKNPDNYQIENLYLISRKENMKQNSVHNYPPEILANVRILAGYKRRLNSYAKQQQQQQHQRPAADAIQHDGGSAQRANQHRTGGHRGETGAGGGEHREERDRLPEIGD